MHTTANKYYGFLIFLFPPTHVLVVKNTLKQIKRDKYHGQTL